MAIYTISQEGIEELQQLAVRLKQLAAGIWEANEALSAQVSAQESKLGLYEEHINECVKTNLILLRQAMESIQVLTDRAIPERIAKIEGFLAEAGGAFGGEDSGPAPKTRVLRPNYSRSR